LGLSYKSKLIASTERPSLGLGRYTLGGADYIISMAIRGLGDKSFTTPVRDNIQYQSRPQLLADEMPNKPRLVHYNAFYTFFSSLYLDFGFLGFIFLGLLIGSSSTFFYLRFLATGSIFDLIWLVFITYNSLMGLFGVTFETPGFWLTFTSLIFINQFKQRQYVQV
jgi:oligosaccharide repeat unit polymerase